jgi:hypothetical protein
MNFNLLFLIADSHKLYFVLMIGFAKDNLLSVIYKWFIESHIINSVFIENNHFLRFGFLATQSYKSISEKNFI